MEDTKNSGGVFQQWHSALLKIYLEVFIRNMKILRSLPISEFYISDGDIGDLLRLAEFFEVEIPEDANLKDINEFKRYLGIIENKAKKMVLIDLRPGNPVEDNLKKVFDKYPDLRMLQKNILGEDK